MVFVIVTMRCSLGNAAVRLAWLVCCHLLREARAFGEFHKYLIVSSPATHRIAYLTLPSPGGPPTSIEPMRVLVDSGLSVPQGIAVDEYRKRLYVADPDLGKLVAYELLQSGDGLTVGSQITVASGVEARWVTVDGVGNVFFTDEATNKVYGIAVGTTGATVLYDGSADAEVSGPGGIVADNFFVYWVNKVSGTTAGTLVRGLSSSQNISGVPKIALMSKHVQKSYGVCLALNNAFYTDEKNSLYALPRTGGGVPITVSSSLQEPRGCAFDGTSTVYVADRTLHAVYSLASSAEYYNSDTPLMKVADLNGAFGVAVYTRVV